MEKFGVDLGVDQELMEKQASEGCPRCGRKDLMRHGQLLFCPVHGSEPFESGKKR